MLYRTSRMSYYLCWRYYIAVPFKTMHLCRTLPWTRIFPKVLAFPAGLEAKHMYCPESTPVRLSKINVQEPSGSSIIMWWGSTSTGFPSERQKGGEKLNSLVSIRFSPWEFHPAFLLERTESCICFFVADVGSWGMSSSSLSSSLQNIPWEKHCWGTSYIINLHIKVKFSQSVLCAVIALIC